MQTLQETQKLEEKMSRKLEKNTEKESLQLQSFREENETLRQMFSIDK